MKKMKKMLCVLTVCILCLTMAATSAFAYGKRLNALSKDEVFECIWNYITQRHSGIDASLMYDECKTFVEQLQMPSKNYDTSDGYKDFLAWYKNNNEGIEIQPYSEKVIKYLQQHPNADLMWSDQGVYDLNVKIETSDNVDKSFRNNLFMQYKIGDMSEVLLWTYDAQNKLFICKDKNDKTIKTVYAYSEPYYKISSVLESSEQLNQSEINVSSSQNTSRIESSVLTEPVTASDTADHPVEESAIEESTVIESSTSEAESTNNDNTTTVVIIVISGIVIAAVFVFLIIRQKKKRTV